MDVGQGTLDSYTLVCTVFSDVYTISIPRITPNRT